MQKIKFYISIFDKTYLCLIGQPEDINRFLKDEIIGDEAGQVFEHDGEYLTYISEGVKNDISIVAHEFSHLVFRVMNEHNIQVKDSTEEIFAYLLEFFVREYKKRLGI